jgi:hypothetical protein
MKTTRLTHRRDRASLEFLCEFLDQPTHAEPVAGPNERLADLSVDPASE